jgi:hypothetical protein
MLCLLPRLARSARLLCVVGALGCAQSRPPSERTDADADTDTPLREEGYYRARAEAMCALSARCCQRAGLRTSTTCVETMLAGVLHWRPDRIAGARYDADAAAACVNGYADLECGLAKADRTVPAACAHVYEPGRRKLGERCTDSSQFECAPSEAGDTFCALTRLREPTESTCVVAKYLNEGEPCVDLVPEPNVEALCDLPLICDEERGLCARRAERGQRCDPTYGDTCAQGSVCDRASRRCVEPPPIGDPCDPADNRCEQLACIGGRCREPLSDFRACER